MSLSLPKPLAQYDVGNEATTRSAIEQADKKNLKTDSPVDKLIFRDQVTGNLVVVTMQNGALTGFNIPYGGSYP